MAKNLTATGWLNSLLDRTQGFFVIAGKTIAGAYRDVAVNDAGEILTATSDTAAIANLPTESVAFSGATNATPNVADEVELADNIVGALISNDEDPTTSSKLLYVSFDGGVTYRALSPNTSIFMELNRASIHVKSVLSASVAYGGWYQPAPGGE